MKKIYQTPQITVAQIEVTLMSGMSGTLDPSQSITSSDMFGSRDYDDWGDE